MTQLGLGMTRRDVLQWSLMSLAVQSVRAAERKAPKILLRSSWQVVNIGDIAHTPGVLALLERFLPEAEVTLWASGDLSPEVIAMEHRRFPGLSIVKGTIDSSGRASNSALQDAISSTDFFLHGSGPSLVAQKDLAAFVKHTGKPFGVYGITYAGGQKELLNQAKFVYFRDSVSLALAKKEGVNAPVMEFGPDGAFACDLRNEPAAEEFLSSNGLEPGKFVCCIPRLRYTPYWLIKPDRKKDPEREQRNEEMEEHDHKPLRGAIEAVVRETECKVLLCPEDMTQIEVGRRAILSKLPEEVRKRVVWRDSYWLTDEALSVYRQSAGLFGLEMHSPIMCLGNGIPALVGRFAEQTSKGWMWKDIGLEEWLFDFDDAQQVARLTPTLLSMIKDPVAAGKSVARAQAFVAQRQADTMHVLRRSVGL